MTPVEWLIEQLQAPCRGIPSHIIEQAKEMEEDRIRDLEWQIDMLKYEIVELKNYGNTNSN